tara:strand:- start:318 stop:932 length:615 start_codon:yes stop_codon:yes gene_type:complete
MRAKMTITKSQIKQAFVSEVKNIGEYVYNNQDWYQEDTQRMRYILATIEMSPGDNYSEKPKQYELGQEDNRFYDCISFEDNGMYKINDEKKLLELINMKPSQVADYISINEYDWIGDDYDHANEYLFTIMNHWQEEVEFDTQDYENPDQMTITKRARQWNVDPETGYKSENKFEVAYQILMDYYNELPEDTRAEVDKRLEAVEC